MWHRPSDLCGQEKISVETHGVTLHSDWPGKDQRLPTARNQLPKQVHLPLTLHCKCSWTERTHIASSKPQPGVRKAIAHCATTLSTDMLHYPEKSLRPAEQFNRSTAREPCYHGELRMISGQAPTPATSTGEPVALHGRQRLFTRMATIEASPQWHYFGLFQEKDRDFLHGMVSLLLNFLLNFIEFIWWTFYEFWNVFELLLCIDYCSVMYWFLLWIFDWSMDWLMIWKIWLILLTCIAL